MGGVRELDYSLDNFQQQKIFDKVNSYAQQIVNLFFLNPGDLPSIPDAGLSIRKNRYKFMEQVTGNEYREEIVNQIKTYIGNNVPLENVRLYYLNKKNKDVYIIEIILSSDNKQQTILFGFNESFDIIDFKIQII